METTIDIAEFANGLGLSQNEGDVFFGRRLGFPVGLKVVDPHGLPLLLFQVRHPLSKDAQEISSITYEDEPTRLIGEKKLDIDFDDRLVWLSFVDGAQHLTDGSVPRLLDSILGSFVAAGLARNAKRCHYCQRNDVESPSCIDGKVAQICPVCLSERISAPENRPVDVSEGALPIATLAPLAVSMGALGWAAFWAGYLLLFETLNTDRIIIPRLLEAVALACVAVATGGPIGYVIKRVRRRGQKLSVGFAVLCTVAAVIVGEVAFVAWLIYREIKLFSPTIAWKILPRLEMEMGAFHLVIKFLAALFAGVIATEMAKPPKPR